MAEEVRQDNRNLDVRELARRGVLADYVAAAPEEERRRRRAELYDVTQPVVFKQLTRKLEIKRGHTRCAVSVRHLEDDCLDRFHDDMDAVLDDVFRNARVPILNIEGWVTKRLTAVTVNAHRRRRGERGALQRPRRIPNWLVTRLGGDDRLVALAADMLEFVGLEVVAGAEIWPIDTWAGQRVAANGDYEAARRAVVRDVETVLAAMRGKPKWYDDYVERPLGRKRAPLLPSPRTGIDENDRPAVGDPVDTRLVELAAVAVEAIEVRVVRGEEPRLVVIDVLRTVFGAADGFGPHPGEISDVDERIAVTLADQVSIDRLVAAVMAIVADGRS